MKLFKTYRGNKIKITQVFKRLKFRQKLLYLLWPLVLILLLTQNFFTLLDFGDYKMAAISHDLTMHMKIEFENYLIPVETLINGLVTNVEQMMDEGSSAKDIEDYLVRQTDLLTGEFAKDTTGLYGYINGTYVDGAHWVPPEDYDPEKRDWYLETVAAGGRIAYVAPYIDAQSGDSSVTVSRLLKDGKSVIALDLKVTSLQRIVDTLMNEGEVDENDKNAAKYKKSSLGGAEGKYILILDNSGKIVVHTDRSMVGINIYKKNIEPYTSIVEHVLKQKERQFDVKFDGNHDSLSTVDINRDWIAIAAVDYYDTFGGIIHVTVYTAVISVAVIIILTLSLPCPVDT